MKMGLITSIFETLTLEQVIDFAAETGLECLEVACWPSSGGRNGAMPAPATSMPGPDQSPGG